MKIENLKIGNVYCVEGLGDSVYMGRLNVDLILEGEKRKGDRMFRVLMMRNVVKGYGLCRLSKKEIEKDIKQIWWNGIKYVYLVN